MAIELTEKEKQLLKKSHERGDKMGEEFVEALNKQVEEDQVEEDNK